MKRLQVVIRCEMDSENPCSGDMRVVSGAGGMINFICEGHMPEFFKTGKTLEQKKE